MRFHFAILFTIAVFAAGSLTGCSAEARKTRWLERAARDYKAGEYDKAKIEYLKVIEIDPKDPEPFVKLGAIWWEEGAPLRAGAFLKRASEMVPNDTANRLRMARVHFTVGQLPEARKEVMTILEQTPNDGGALVLLTEMARTPEDLPAAEIAVQNFTEKETASYQIAVANVAIRKQDVPTAEAAIKRAVELEPKNPEAHQAMGILHLLQQDPKRAREEFKTAAELAPIRSPVRTTYAEYLSKTESPEAASAFLKEITDKAPDFLPAWIMLARQDFAKKKYDEAIKQLGNVFSRDPINIDACLLRADCLIAKNEPDKALEELEKIEKNYPGLPLVKYRFAQAYLQQKKAPQALTVLDQAIIANPNYLEAILLRAQINLQSGNPAAAVSALEEVLKGRAGLRPAQLLLAEGYRATGRLDDAANIFQEQIKQSPETPEFYFFLGVIQQQQKKIEEARASFEKVLTLAPENLLALSRLVELDLEQKDFPRAMGQVQSQLEKRPEVPALHFLQAKVLRAQKDSAGTEKALKKAMELDPKFLSAYEMLVSLYLEDDRLPEAIRQAEAVLSQNQKNEGAWMTLGLIYEKQKEYQKAADAYEKVLAVNESFIPALNNLAYLSAVHLNQLDKAYELAKKARTLDPVGPAISDTLGWVLFKRGDYQQAVILLQESLEKSGGSAEIGFHLGMAHSMMGQTDAARAAFQRALASTGDFPSRAEAESRLALLGDGSGQAQTMSVEQLEPLVKEQPNDPVTRMRLAEAYETKGALAQAAEAYEAALKLNPKLAPAALKLAQLYGGPLANREKALSYAKLARELSPSDPTTTAVLGRIAFETGDFPWSYNLLQESARQLTADPQVLHDLAWAAYSIGKVDDARGAMERCLKASPEPATADDAKSFL
ncbi:MAG: tetratricopeptide repeat protein, partial [Chthoniobacterales bacterium]